MNFIKEWVSIQCAGVGLKIRSPGGISNCCKGKILSSAGFIWRYKNPKYEYPKREELKWVNHKLVKIN